MGFLSFALSPIGRMLIGGAVLFSLGTFVGFRGEKAFSDARWFKAQAAAKELTIATLQARIKVTKEAAASDAQRAADAEQRRNDAEERARNAETLIANSPAFDAADTDRVRDLWRPAARGNPKR